MIISDVFINLVGLLVFLFIFWKKTKEDYVPNQIFTASIFILLGLAAGIFLSLKFFPKAWFWTSILGVFVGLTVGIINFKLRFFETFDASVIGLFPWLGLYFLNNSVKNSNLIAFLAFVVVVLLIALYQFLDLHYKNLVWYPSGRIGFSSLLVLSVFFLLRSLIAYFSPFMISFVGFSEAVLSSTAFIVSTCSLIYLARKV